MSAEDILKRPVHEILHTKTPIETTPKKFHHSYERVNEKQPLPEEPKPENPTTLLKMDMGSPFGDFRKQEKLKRRLSVIYASIPKMAPDKVPPCSTCVAVCCSSYIVPILKEEYESGIYGEYAVKLTVAALKQLKTQHNLPFKWLPNDDQKDAYVLEGEVGQDCPYLGADRRCTIYESRPRTCRVYTCKDDARITDDMRSGKVDPIFASIKIKE